MDTTIHELIRILAHLPLHRHHSKIISPNELIVLCAVDSHKNSDPHAIAESLGALPKTYMRICRDLADRQLLVVKAPIKTRPGRPAYVYGLSNQGAAMTAAILKKAIKSATASTQTTDH